MRLKLYNTYIEIPRERDMRLKLIVLVIKKTVT